MRPKNPRSLGQKVFADRKAERLFVSLYEKLTPTKQKAMGQMVRDLFWQKMEGDGDEFYITAKEVRVIWDSQK